MGIDAAWRPDVVCAKADLLNTARSPSQGADAPSSQIPQGIAADHRGR
jgi:hypothetical protein